MSFIQGPLGAMAYVTLWKLLRGQREIMETAIYGGKPGRGLEEGGKGIDNFTEPYAFFL